MAICIHLSAWMLSNQGYLGIADPGKHNNTRLTINHPIAGRKRRIVKLKLILEGKYGNYPTFPATYI